MTIDVFPKEDFDNLKRAFREEHDADLMFCWGRRHFEDMFDIFSSPSYKKESPKTFKALQKLKNTFDKKWKKEVNNGMYKKI